MIEHYFVTGTDTEVGKTYFCGTQIKTWLPFLKQSKAKIAYVKPVQTGIEEVASDGEVILSRLSSNEKKLMKPHFLVLREYQKSASPHLAASLTKQKIDFNSLLKEIQDILKNYSHVLVEGAGGVLVPLEDNTLLIDVITALQLPVIIVAKAGLGTINHTLLTVEALQKRNNIIAKIILNPYFSSDSDTQIVLDNAHMIQKITNISVEWMQPIH